MTLRPGEPAPVELFDDPLLMGNESRYFSVMLSAWARPTPEAGVDIGGGGVSVEAVAVGEVEHHLLLHTAPLEERCTVFLTQRSMAQSIFIGIIVITLERYL